MNWFWENRWRLLLAVVLAVLWSSLCGVVFDQKPAKTGEVNRVYLEKAYADYNAQYFGNKLPKNTAIGYNLHDPNFVALTTEAGGRFHINFNPAFAGADMMANLIMLHEMCHIKNFGDTHKRRWIACMTELDNEGAFREELIYSYQE